MKPIHVKSDSYSEYNGYEKDPEFKIGGNVRISKFKDIFAAGYILNWSEEIFIISKIKNTVSWTYVNGSYWKFFWKRIAKSNQKEFRIEKIIKRKGHLWNGKNMVIHSIIKLIKETYYKESQYFPKPFRKFRGNISVNINLSNYATKSDIKNISHFDTSSFELKTNLVSLKADVDKLDFDQFVSVPVDLSKLSNVVKNVVIKKAMFDKLVAKVNNIDTGGFVCLKKIWQRQFRTRK